MNLPILQSEVKTMSKFYFLTMDGLAIQANEGDTVHELAVAETILDYLKTVCPGHDFDIAEAVFADEQLTSEGVV